eukprot:PhM_4_TR6278/c0_g1_i1/m.30245
MNPSSIELLEGRVSDIAGVLSDHIDSLDRLFTTKIRRTESSLLGSSSSKNPNASPFCLSDHVEELQKFEDTAAAAAAAVTNDLNSSITDEDKKLEERRANTLRAVASYGLMFHPEDLDSLLQCGSPDTMWFLSVLHEMAAKDEKISAANVLQRTNKMRALVDIPCGQDWITKGVMEYYALRHEDALRFVMQDVAGMDEELLMAQSKVRVLEVDKKNAEASEDVVRMESVHRELVAAIEAVLEIRHRRLDEWVQSRTDVSEHLRNVREHDSALLTDVNTYETTTKTVHGKVSLDITTLENILATESQNNTKALEEFGAKRTSLWSTLRQNAKEHENTWSEILGLFESLHIAAKRRKALGEELMRATLEEQKRRAQYATVTKMIQSHLSTLRKGFDYTMHVFKVTDGVREYCKEQMGAIERRGFLQNVLDNSRRESEAYLKEFDQYVNFAGDLVMRKEHHLDGLNRQIRSLKHSLEIAPNTLDTNMKTYEESLERLYGTKASVHKDVLDLHAKLNSHTQQFVLAEDVLRAANIEFEHPMLEFQENEVNRRGGMVQKVATHLEVEQEEVESTMTRVRKVVTSATVQRASHRASHVSTAAVYKKKSISVASAVVASPNMSAVDATRGLFLMGKQQEGGENDVAAAASSPATSVRRVRGGLDEVEGEDYHDHDQQAQNRNPLQPPRVAFSEDRNDDGSIAQDIITYDEVGDGKHYQQQQQIENAGGDASSVAQNFSTLVEEEQHNDGDNE